MSRHTDHQFGGDWTEKKLALLEKYLRAYTTALKNQNFRTAYIDAFAGTGTRTQTNNAIPESETSLFDALGLDETAKRDQKQLLEGSARIALRTEPPFTKYVFIERDPRKCESLRMLKQEFPHLAERIDVRQGDANKEIQKICGKKWKSERAVMFLDPYGLQVDWETVEAIAKTKAIDLWLLFPHGIGVNRILVSSGRVPESWAGRLDQFFGDTSWREVAYRPADSQPLSLFDDEEVSQIKQPMNNIADYFNQRLGRVFAGVADHYAVLQNSAKCPLYLLFFAAGNPAGAKIACKIANDLLKDKDLK